MRSSSGCLLEGCADELAAFANALSLEAVSTNLPHRAESGCLPLRAEAEPMPLGDALGELEAAVQQPERLDVAVENVIYALDSIPAFQRRGETNGRCMTDSYASALQRVSSRVRDLAAVAVVFDDILDAVSRRIANTSTSRYEQSAAVAWPSHSVSCPDLVARFHLSASGLVTYTLGPSSSSWELVGEGCWRALPIGRPSTEIMLELRQGLCGSAPSPDGTLECTREAPCTLYVDLRMCGRVMLDGSSGDDEEAEEDSDDGDDDDDGNGD